jgi:hypothetical protein
MAQIGCTTTHHFTLESIKPFQAKNAKSNKHRYNRDYTAVARPGSAVVGTNKTQPSFSPFAARSNRGGLINNHIFRPQTPAVLGTIRSGMAGNDKAYEELKQYLMRPQGNKLFCFPAQPYAKFKYYYQAAVAHTEEFNTIHTLIEQESSSKQFVYAYRAGLTSDHGAKTKNSNIIYQSISEILADRINQYNVNNILLLVIILREPEAASQDNMKSIRNYTLQTAQAALENYLMAQVQLGIFNNKGEAIGAKQQPTVTHQNVDTKVIPLLKLKLTSSKSSFSLSNNRNSNHSNSFGHLPYDNMVDNSNQETKVATRPFTSRAYTNTYKNRFNFTSARSQLRNFESRPFNAANNNTLVDVANDGTLSIKWTESEVQTALESLIRGDHRSSVLILNSLELHFYRLPSPSQENYQLLKHNKPISHLQHNHAHYSVARQRNYLENGQNTNLQLIIQTIYTTECELLFQPEENSPEFGEVSAILLGNSETQHYLVRLLVKCVKLLLLHQLDRVSLWEKLENKPIGGELRLENFVLYPITRNSVQYGSEIYDSVISALREPQFTVENIKSLENSPAFALFQWLLLTLRAIRMLHAVNLTFSAS